MNFTISRRSFLNHTAITALVAGFTPELITRLQAAGKPGRIRPCLAPGSIGVKADPRETLKLAEKYGFEAVEANAAFLSGLGDSDLAALKAEMREKDITFGAAGLSVNFRQDDAKFKASLEAFPKQAASLQRAGVERMGTWITPASDELPYAENLKQHAQRLREAAKILRDHGLRLGLEYVGTPTSRKDKKYPFIHSMRQMKELISEIGTGNVGFVLDTWHWWTAGETEADLLSLTAKDVVSVDLNDAPAGIPVDKQLDGQRELPCATGVIPVKAFLGALKQIGYEGPARCEPFNQKLRDLDNDAACAAVIAALKKALALVQ